MLFSNLFLFSCRSASMLIVLVLGLVFSLESFTFKSIFIGLLFSHFAMGFYYSKNNVMLMKQKKFALIIATIILLVGLYFAFYITHLAPYFLVVHAALSDAYLLRMKSTIENGELLALIRTVFYSAFISVAFIEMPEAVMNTFLVIGAFSFIAIFNLSQSKSSLTLFEIPLIAVVFYTQITHQPLHFQYMGFYHILTWYVFSFWMLFVKEKNIQKGMTFFSKIAVMSVAFIFLFSNLLDYTITDASFLKIIGIGSLLHIFTTIPLSKFNPAFIKKIFYVT